MLHCHLSYSCAFAVMLVVIFYGVHERMSGITRGKNELCLLLHFAGPNAVDHLSDRELQRATALCCGICINYYYSICHDEFICNSLSWLNYIYN